MLRLGRAMHEGRQDWATLDALTWPEFVRMDAALEAYLEFVDLETRKQTRR